MHNDYYLLGSNGTITIIELEECFCALYDFIFCEPLLLCLLRRSRRGLFHTHHRPFCKVWNAHLHLLRHQLLRLPTQLRHDVLKLFRANSSVIISIGCLEDYVEFVVSELIAAFLCHSKFKPCLAEWE